MGGPLMNRRWFLFFAGILVGLTGVFGSLPAAEPKFDDAVNLLGQEKFGDTEKILSLILAKTPDAMNARLLMGWALWSQDRYDEALVRFKSVLHDAPFYRAPTAEEYSTFNLTSDVTSIENPDFLQARKGLGWTYFKKGWVRLAHEQFTYLNRRYSKWDEPYLGLGFVFLAQGKFKESESAFLDYLDRTDAGTKKPQEGERGLGDLYAAQGQHSKAISHYEKALAAKPGWLEVQSGLAWSSFRAGQKEKAARLFTLLKKPRPIEAETGLAWVALREDRLDDAEAGFARALAGQPGYGAAIEGSRELRLRRYKAFDDAWGLYYAGKYRETAAAFETLTKTPGRMPATMKPFILNGHAWSRLRLKETDEAEKLFRASLQELPKGAEATAGLGWIAIQRKEWDKAEKALVEANTVLPGLTAVTDGFAQLYAARFASYDQAWGLYYQGKYNDAIKTFEAILAKPGDLPSASLPFVRGGIGWSELALGQVDQAEKTFKQIQPASKMDEAEAKSGFGWVALKRNRPEEAQKLFVEAVTAVPGYGAALRGFAELRKARAPELDQAWLAYYQGKFDQASAGFKKVADNASLPADYRREARRGYTWSLHFGGKFQEAAAEFDRLLKDGEDADLLYGRGLALGGVGQHQAAAPLLKRAAEFVPYSADYHLAHGRALLKAGDAKESLAAFTKAYQIAPASAEVNRNLGWAYAKDNRPAEAKAAFRYALTLIPGYSDDKEFRDLTNTKEYRDLRSDLAWGYVRWQAFDPARKLFEEIAKADSADGDAWFGHGYALYKLGKGAEAERSLNRAMKAKRPAFSRTVWVVFPGAGGYPVLTDPYSIQGWISLVRDRCDEALDRFEASLHRDPEMVASMVGRATCLAKAGDTTQAREIYLTAREVYPTYPSVLAGLRETEPKKTVELR